MIFLISYILTFTEGILTFISPCILPMLPIYFIYLAGASEDGSGAAPQDRRRMIINSAGFVIGFTIVFVALGATVTSIGHFLVSNRPLLQKLSGAVMVLFGLHFAGILRLGFLDAEKRIGYTFTRLRFLSSIVFGIVFGFGWTPCLGAFLGSALLLAGSSETILRGVLLLFIYSLGLGLPFLLTAVLFDRAKGAIRRLQKHGRAIRLASGILLIAAGILVYTDSLKFLNPG